VKRTIFLIFVMAVSAAIPANGQTKTTKNLVKPKPIRATVTVRGGSPPLRPLPNETDADIWNAFELKGDGLRMLFPAKNADIFEDSIGPVRSFQATTNKANYLLAIRELETPIDNREIDDVLESIIKAGFQHPDTRLLEKRNISYEGRLGKHLITQQRTMRSIARIYVLNGKVFAISVTIKSKDLDQTFEKWIAKFLDSFRVEVSAVGEA
jgi:hypothetical protein